MTHGEAEGRILDTLRGEYLRTGELDWWTARDLCLAAAVPEEFFDPAVDSMVPRRLVDTRIDPKGARFVRLGPPGTSRTRYAQDRAVPSIRGDRGRGSTSRLATWLGALMRPLRGLIP